MTMGLVTRKLKLADIQLDPSLQPRQMTEAEHDEYAGELAEVLEHGDELHGSPPVVFHDGSSYWLADGWNRHRAHTIAGRSDML
jgi:hypothetical protein